MIKQPTLWAYISIKPSLGMRQKEVLNAIRFLGPIYNLKIANYLGLPINSVTPRVKELRDLGKVKEAYLGQCSETGRLVTYWEEDRGVSSCQISESITPMKHPPEGVGGGTTPNLPRQ